MLLKRVTSTGKKHRMHLNQSEAAGGNQMNQPL
jgi:hypothetical protein